MTTHLKVQTYRISGHPAASGLATLEVTVDRPFVTSITTASEFTLFTTDGVDCKKERLITIRAAGVPMIPMTAAILWMGKDSRSCSSISRSSSYPWFTDHSFSISCRCNHNEL
jgi:hypothetical protein